MAAPDGAGRRALRRQAPAHAEGLPDHHPTAHERVHRRVRRSRPPARGHGSHRRAGAATVADDADGVLGAGRFRAGPGAVLQRCSVCGAPQASRAAVRRGDAAHAGAGARAQGARAGGEAAGDARHVPRDERERHGARRQVVLADLRKVRGAALAGLPASGRHDRPRPHAALLSAQPARQSVRHRRRRGASDLRRRARRVSAPGGEPAACRGHAARGDRPARPRHQRCGRSSRT